MANGFDIKRGDVFFSFDFRAPALGIMQGNLPLALQETLASAGFSIDTLTFTLPTTSLGQLEFRVPLYSERLVATVSLTKVTLHVPDLLLLEAIDLPGTTKALFRAVRKVSPKSAPAQFSAVIALHGPMRPSPAAVRPPDPNDGLGPLAASGSAFYFGEEGDRLRSSITMDLSAFSPDWTFVKIDGAWRIGKPAISNAFTTWWEYLGRAHSLIQSRIEHAEPADRK